MSKMTLPGKMVAFVAETLNGDRRATCLDENGMTWRADLSQISATLNGEGAPPFFAADAREGWIDIRDPERRGIALAAPDQPHGVATIRKYGTIELLIKGPVDRIDAKLSGPEVALAREAVAQLRKSANPRAPKLAGRSFDENLMLADRLEKALNELTW